MAYGGCRPTNSDRPSEFDDSHQLNSARGNTTPMAADLPLSHVLVDICSWPCT